MILSEILGNTWKSVVGFAGYRRPETSVNDDSMVINYSTFYEAINRAERIRQEKEEAAMFDGGKTVLVKGQWVDPGNGNPVQV